MIKHDKKLKAAFKHFRKTGDTEPMTNILVEQSVKAAKELPAKIRTVA